jgi:hypothetical protein
LRLKGQKIMKKTNLKLIKREGDFCVGGVWDICGLHGRVSVECFDCARRQ